MALNVPVRHMRMPQGGKPPVSLMGFDFGPHLFHLLAFDFGDDGGAVGIWRDGDKFCARISLDSLAEFWQQAKDDKAGARDAGHELHRAVLAAVEGLMRGDPGKDSPQGKALEQLAAAVESYERATLPPPFGTAGVLGTHETNTPESRDSQHVLKAEAARPDATDRGNPGSASPDGGPMGVGQAAAAAPAGRGSVPPGHTWGAGDADA